MYSSSTKVKIFDKVDVTLTELGSLSLTGNQEFTLDASIKNSEPISLTFRKRTIKPPTYVKCRGVAINYETTDSSSSFSVKSDYQMMKKISLSLDIKEESDSKACTATMVTPFESMKDAKVHISVGRQSSRSNLLFYIDMNKEENVMRKKIVWILKKITGGYSIHIGNVTFIVTESDNDFKTKVAFKVKNKTVGFEINLDKRATALDCYVYLPQRTSALRSSFLEKNGHVNFKIAAIPNIKDSENKYGFEMEKEIKPSNEIRTTYKMSYPEMAKPLVTCETQEVRNTIVGLKCVVQSDSRRGKTLTAEMIPDRENGFVVYTIYSEDKSLDASFKVIQKSSSEKDEIGYEWKYSSPSDHRKGGAIVTLYDKKYGSPKSMKIAYYSPSSEYEVLGSVANAPKDASLSLASVGAILAYIQIKASDSCLNMEVTNLGQTVKSSLCIKTNENNSLPFITAEFYHREQKKLDLRIGVDPDIPTFVDVDIKWKAADILRAVSEVSGWDSIFPHISIWEWKRDVIQIFLNIKNYIKDKLVDVKNDILEKLVKVKEDILKKLVNIKDDILKKLVNIKDDILKKLVNIKDAILEKISQRIEINLANLGKLIHSGVKMLKDQIDSVFGQFLGDTILHQIARYALKIESKIRQKVINLIDEAINNMNNLFNQDEDYRILKDIVNDRKEKVMHAWRNKEEIAENSFRHIKEKFMNKIRRMIHGLIQIIEFDSEKGILQFRFRQPLGPSEIKIMKNELRTLERLRRTLARSAILELSFIGMWIYRTCDCESFTS
ncbi:vitellogenin [Caerostris extrusa]|uniref:Vitellogenin n=1 Tax=Caerostris extrusa TaxID=172846 RepID=A0AAV4X8E7_CAEEX|nr:vitellogenin [Caerostris extrusa]